MSYKRTCGNFHLARCLL